MPAIITRAPIDTVRKDTGSGGRPPAHRRPTGGWGGGDENRDRGDSQRGPRDLLARYRMGLGFALAGDVIFFIVLSMAFFAEQHVGRIASGYPYEITWKPFAIPPIFWINTAILLVSCCTMEMARRGVFREIDAVDEWLGLGRPISQRALPWMLSTITLGALFLAGQWIGWKQLAAERASLQSNPALHFFSLVAGIDGVHLALGVAAVVFALVLLRWSSRRLEIRQIAVDVTGWYWHAMTALWLCLFALMLASR